MGNSKGKEKEKRKRERREGIKGNLKQGGLCSLFLNKILILSIMFNLKKFAVRVKFNQVNNNWIIINV